MPVRIVTDSTCDLPDQALQQHGIRVVPLYLNIEGQGYLDGVEISRQEFYTRLPGYSTHPTTATPGTDAFRAAYDQLAEQGASEVLSIHISESLSATVEVARQAAKGTQSLPVTVLDGRQLSLGTGFIVLEAAELASAGLPAAEIVAALQDKIQRTHVFAALDTLEFLRRSGRMNGILAGLGTWIQLKPLLTMHDGKAGAERVRTRERAFHRLLKMLKAQAPLEQVGLVHANAPDAAEELRERAKKLLPAGEIWSVDITPVIGAHIGPGAAGFACVSAKR